MTKNYRCFLQIASIVFYFVNLLLLNNITFQTERKERVFKATRLSG